MPLLISTKTCDDQLRKKVKEISGEDFQKCYQCGTCSGSCPMVESFTLPVRQVMALLQLGHREKLEESNSAFVCASCHTCTVRCPRGIDIAKLMEALRQVKLRLNVDEVKPNKIKPEDLAEMPQIAMVSGFRKLTS